MRRDVGDENGTSIDGVDEVEREGLAGEDEAMEVSVEEGEGQGGEEVGED
jgi:hypothetical protein